MIRKNELRTLCVKFTLNKVNIITWLFDECT